jgi:hypothetical protein
MIILLYARVVGLLYTLLVCWFFFSAVCSCSPVFFVLSIAVPGFSSVLCVTENSYTQHYRKVNTPTKYTPHPQQVHTTK